MAIYGPMSLVVSEWLPSVIVFLDDYGLLAVQVFLVVGGYLNAKSWTRGLNASDLQFFSKASSRYLRSAFVGGAVSGCGRDSFGASLL
jgi:hypothetical protein